jgi:hypothetical protein
MNWQWIKFKITIPIYWFKIVHGKCFWSTPHIKFELKFNSLLLLMSLTFKFESIKIKWLTQNSWLKLGKRFASVLLHSRMLDNKKNQAELWLWAQSHVGTQAPTTKLLRTLAWKLNYPVYSPILRTKSSPLHTKVMRCLVLERNSGRIKGLWTWSHSSAHSWTTSPSYCPDA